VAAAVDIIIPITILLLRTNSIIDTIDVTDRTVVRGNGTAIVKEEEEGGGIGIVIGIGKGKGIVITNGAVERGIEAAERGIEREIGIAVPPAAAEEGAGRPTAGADRAVATTVVGSVAIATPVGGTVIAIGIGKEEAGKAEEEEKEETGKEESAVVAEDRRGRGIAVAGAVRPAEKEEGAAATTNEAAAEATADPATATAATEAAAIAAEAVTIGVGGIDREVTTREVILLGGAEVVTATITIVIIVNHNSSNNVAIGATVAPLRSVQRASIMITNGWTNPREEEEVEKEEKEGAAEITITTPSRWIATDKDTAAAIVPAEAEEAAGRDPNGANRVPTIVVVVVIIIIVDRRITNAMGGPAEEEAAVEEMDGVVEIEEIEVAGVAAAMVAVKIAESAATTRPE